MAVVMFLVHPFVIRGDFVQAPLIEYPDFSNIIISQNKFILQPNFQDGKIYLLSGYFDFYPKYEILDVIYSLIECESRWDDKAVGDNGKAQGILQFHFETFKRYSLKYKIVLTEEEAKEKWKDKEYQIKTAYYMLEEDKNNWTHWYNCGVKNKIYQKSI
jgi:hypothetical protein